MYSKNLMCHILRWPCNIGLGLEDLTPFSTIFQLYRDGVILVIIPMETDHWYNNQNYTVTI